MIEVVVMVSSSCARRIGAQGLASRSSRTKFHEVQQGLPKSIQDMHLSLS